MSLSTDRPVNITTKDIEILDSLNDYPVQSEQIENLSEEAAEFMLQSHSQNMFPALGWNKIDRGSISVTQWIAGGPYPYGLDKIFNIYSDIGMFSFPVEDARPYKDKRDGLRIYKDRADRLADWLAYDNDNDRIEYVDIAKHIIKTDHSNVEEYVWKDEIPANIIKTFEELKTEDMRERSEISSDFIDDLEDAYNSEHERIYGEEKKKFSCSDIPKDRKMTLGEQAVCGWYTDEPMKSQEEFKEDDHPRDNDGQFSEKEDSGGNDDENRFAYKYGKKINLLDSKDKLETTLAEIKNELDNSDKYGFDSSEISRLNNYVEDITNSLNEKEKSEKLFNKRLEKEKSKKGTMVNGQLQIKEKIPEFSSIKDVKKWVSDMGEKYGGKNRFLSSNVYREASPKISAVYDRENNEEAKQWQDAMKEKGHKVGDVVEYTYVGNSLWQEPYAVKGTIKMDKYGFPYIRGTDKKRYKWHKGFKKMSGESVIVREGNEYYNVSREEFKEEDHPRGQPDNSGQFVSGSGNKKKAERIRYDRYTTSGFKDAKKRSLQSLSMLNRHKDVGVTRYGETDEEYEKKVELKKQAKNYERDIEVLKNITNNPTSEQLKEIDNTAKSMLLDNELDEKFPDVSYKFTHYPNRKFTISVSGFSDKYPYDLYTVAKKYENNEMSGPDGYVNRKGVIVDIDYRGGKRPGDYKLFPNRETRLANWMYYDIGEKIRSSDGRTGNKGEKIIDIQNIIINYINDGVIDEKYSDIMKNTIKEFEEQEKKENAETIIVKEGNEYYEVKLYSHEEFKEEDHPRGQPENSGQFVSGGGSKSNEPNSEPEKDYKWNGINFAHMVPRQLGDAYSAIEDPAKKEELKRLWNEKLGGGEISPDMMEKYSFLSEVSEEKEKEIKKEVERKLKPKIVETKNELGFLVQDGVTVTKSKKINSEGIKKVRDLWNKIPPEHRRNVKHLRLLYGNGGGSWNFGKNVVSVGINHNFGKKYDGSIIGKGSLYHEIGHSNLAHWPLEIQRKWNERVKNTKPITKYTRSYLRGKQNKFQRDADDLKYSVNTLLQNPNDSHMKYVLSNILKAWGIGEKEILDGTLKKMSDSEYEQTYHVYQNEQFAEFMASYHGYNTRPVNKKAYNELKVIYEELQLESYETHESYAGESYKKYVEQKMNVLKRKANENEEVGYLFSPKLHRHGKKIHGTLAYAGISLNNRLYLPEALSKGHNLRLRLLLNHSSTAGAEEELHRLEPEMRKALENGEDYEVGWVELEWKAEELTLYYKGEIEHPFFQKEVDEMDMSVSLGLVFDSNSPQVCDEQCYTVIMGAEWREVSLVYHPGFPIATIEAMENKMRSNENFFLSNEFDEDKHPRGQPDNAGQFVKNGGSSDKSDQPESKKDPFEIKSGANYKNWRNVGTGDKYNEHSFKTEKYALDIILRQEHPKDDLMGVIASTHNDELYKFDDQKALESIWNGYAMENYENAKVLYRSMSTNELDSMLENDIMFSKSESRDYIPTTTDFDVAYDIPYSSEIIVLEFDKNQLDKYLVHPRYERGAFEKPEIDSPKESFYLYESEHRLLNKTVNHKELDFTIKAYNVYDKEKFKSKYSGLGKIEFLEKSEEAFKEEDHPRGQPDNAGQFAEKEGGSNKNNNTNYKWNGINFAHMVPRQLVDAYKAIQDPSKKEELKRLWNEKVKRGEVSPDMMDKYSFLSDISKEKEEEIKKEVERKLKPPIIEKKNELGFLVQDGVTVEVSERISKENLEKIAKTWNEIPPERRRNVKILNLKRSIYERGFYKFGLDRVTIHIGSSWGSNDNVGLLYHEIGHSNSAHWPLNIIKEWNKRTKNIDAITDYSESWRRTKKGQTRARRINKKIDHLIKFPNDAGMKYNLSNVLKEWNITDDDITNGKLKNMKELYYESEMNMYQDEQHSEFVSIYYGNDIDSLINKSAYNQLKEIYEELQLKSYETHEVFDNMNKSVETIIVRKGNEYYEVGIEEFKEEDHPRDSDGQFASKYSWNGKNYSDLSPNEIASIYQLVDDPDRKKDLKKEWDKIIQNKNVEDLMRKSHPHMFEQSIFNDASPQKIADLYKETDDPNVKRMLKDEWDSRVEKDDIFKHDRQEWSHMNFTQQKDPDIDDTLDRNPWKGKGNDKQEQKKIDDRWKNMSRGERQENLNEVSEKPTPDISDSDWGNFSSYTRAYIHGRVGEMSEAEKSRLVNEVKEKINPRVREYMNKRTGWKVQKGVEVDTKQIRNKAFTDSYRDAWNKIPGSRKRNVKKITFLRAHNTRKNTDPGGRYNFKKDEIEFYYHGDSHNWKGNYAGIMEHEIGHSNLTVGWSVEAQKEWIEGSKKIDPMTTYVGEYKDDYKTDDGSPNSVEEIKTWTREFLNEATKVTYDEAYDHDFILAVAKDKTRSLRKRWGTTAEDVRSGKFLKMAKDYAYLMNNRYSDEQHAEFVAAYYSSEPNYRNYNKGAFNQLKELRERIMLKYKITEAFVGESNPRESIIIKENGRYYEMGTEDFKEHEHPRDGDGKFSKKNEKLVKLLNIQHESNDLYRSHVKKYDKILGDHIKKMKDIRSTSSNEEIDKMEKIKNDKLDDITKEYRLRRRHLNSVMHEMEERFKTDSEFRSELRTVASDNDKNASSYTHMSSMFQEYIDFDKESDEFLTDRLNVVESVFRGINEKEYADLIQQKYFGEKSSPVGFVRVSTNKTVVMEKFMKFAMIEFSKKNINIINQGYTNEYDNDSTSEEGINGKQGYAFFFEEEFRIESNMKIPRSELKIHFYDIPKNKQSEILNECGHLGDVVFNSKKKSNETVIVKSGNEYYEMSTEDFKEHEHPRGGNPKNPGEFSENPGDGNDGDDDDKNDSEDKNVDHKFIDTIKNKMRKNISKALSPDFLKEANGVYVVLDDEFMDTFLTLKNQHPELWDEFKKSQFPLETRDYEKSDKIFESIMSKIRAPVLRQNKAITVAYNDIMDEKMADPSTIAKRFTKLNEVYDILKTGMLRENDDTKILSLQAEGGYDTYKSFTVADNHKYSGYGVEIRVPVKDMDFKVLKATPFARLSKSVKDGQYIRPHDLEQAEIRIKTTDGAKLPDNAEIMIDSHWIDNLEDKKRAAEIHRLIKESKFKIVDKDGNAYK